MATLYYTRALTGLDLSRPEFQNCFVFAIAPSSSFDVGKTGLYVFSMVQDSTSLLAALRMLGAGTLQRQGMSNYSFQSLVPDAYSFAGAYDLNLINQLSTPGSVHIALRSRATGRRPRGPFTFPSWDQIYQALLRFLESLRLDQSINIAIMSADIGNAPSLSGWVARFDSAPSWMLMQIQSGN